MPNFFQLYHDYTSEYEPPPNYHAWSALGAVSALLGKKCYIPFGTFNAYPNLYIILVGKPGLRKSSAMNVAKRLVRMIETVKTASDCGSREGLMDEMTKNRVEAGAATYWQSAIFVDEIADLLGGEHLDKSMIQFLTTIWDVAMYREATRKSGQVCIHNPYLTLLGCCPTEWMMTKLKQDVFTGGLVRRMIFVLETKIARINSRPPTPNLELLAQLALEAQRIHDINGAFTLSKEAWQVFDFFYQNLMLNIDTFPSNLQIYLSSKHMLVLKVAMGLSAGVDSTRVISSQMIRTALAFLGQAEQNLPELFSGVGRNELKSYSEIILNKIKAAGKGGLSKSIVMREHYADLTTVELNEILTMLQDTKQITMSPGSAASGVPTFSAPESAPPLPALDLLPLACQLTPCSEQRTSTSEANVPIRHLDPITEQLLAGQAAHRKMTSSGVLLRGTPSPTSVSPGSLSVKLPL